MSCTITDRTGSAFLFVFLKRPKFPNVYGAISLHHIYLFKVTFGARTEELRSA